MTFIEAYKRLDNLCKDMYSDNKGVSAYIESMENINSAVCKTYEWNLVYKNLKHYRYIRNQIVHENYATEENMCDESDVQWIDSFYHQIIETDDPLARYHKSLQSKQQTREQTSVPLRTAGLSQKNHQSSLGLKKIFLIIALIIFISVSLYVCHKIILYLLLWLNR